MNSFLQHIAKELYREYKDQISDFCFVFPGKRAALYFGKYLGDISNKPIWSPKMLSIFELISELTPIKPLDNLSLLFELFEVYKKEKKSNENFNDFYYWGEMMLNDFDDLDKYLVNSKDLFINLSNLKSFQDKFYYLSEEQIEAIQQFWKNFNPQIQSQQKKDFIEVWEILHTIYSQFRSNLQQKKLGYEGMIYREIAEKMKQNEVFEIAYPKIFFIGFNALNTAEEIILNYFKNAGVGHFFWDYDEIYIKDLNHEAGLFIRKNLTLFPNYPIPIKYENLTNSTKKIETYSVSTAVGQAKLIPELLSESQTNIETAVILADETLLLPVINSIPSNIENINITMGFPLNLTPIYGLLEHILALQQSIQTDSDGNNLFYYKHCLHIINHQYIIQSNNTLYTDITDYINKHNRIYLKSQELCKNNLLTKIFIKIDNGKALSDYLIDILIELNKGIDTKTVSSLDKEYIFNIYKTINRIKDILTEKEIIPDISVFMQILKKIIDKQSIPFTGEPLEGLQIMGLLETRCIDFKNIIILSVNEDKLPKTSVSSSFIPYNLRKGFNLPTIEHQDAIYAYYFYRCIQRAETIKLVYSTRSDSLNKDQISRFIYQLKYDSNFNINENRIVYNIKINEPKSITIRKNTAIIEQLNDYSKEKKISPTAINSFLDCSLKFYFRYIAGIDEPEIISEEIDASVFGSIFHRAIYTLYLPYRNKTITIEELDKIQNNNIAIENAILEAFATNYFKEKQITELKGRNVIIKEVLKKYLLNLFQSDKKFAPFDIIDLEKHIITKVSTKFGNINIHGNLDRIDKIRNTIRIVDYKTGSVSLTSKDLNKLFDRGDHNRNGEILQTLIYSKLYVDTTKPTTKLAPSLYPIKEMNKDTFDCSISINNIQLKDYSEIAEEFNSKLIETLESIFHPETDFIQTENTKICEYCPYVSICHKE